MHVNVLVAMTQSIFFQYLQFAYCYPYSYTQLQQYLDGVEKMKHDYFKRETIGYSVVRENAIIMFYPFCIVHVIKHLTQGHSNDMFWYCVF